MRGYRHYLTRKQRNIEPDNTLPVWWVVISVGMIIGGIILILKG